jgi:hypothetical protein
MVVELFYRSVLIFDSPLQILNIRLLLTQLSFHSLDLIFQVSNLLVC